MRYKELESAKKEDVNSNEKWAFLPTFHWWEKTYGLSANSSLILGWGGGYFHFATVLFTQNCRAIHFVFDWNLSKADALSRSLFSFTLLVRASFCFCFTASLILFYRKKKQINRSTCCVCKESKLTLTSKHVDNQVKQKIKNVHIIHVSVLGRSNK